MSIIILPFFIFVLVPACIGAMITCDLLVRLEYTSHRANWEADGEPFGVVWTPPGRKRGLSYAFGNFWIQTLSWQWLFSTPDWMLQDSRALRLVRWLRICSTIWMIGAVLLVGILITTQGKR